MTKPIPGEQPRIFKGCASALKDEMGFDFLLVVGGYSNDIDIRTAVSAMANAAEYEASLVHLMRVLLKDAEAGASGGCTCCVERLTRLNGALGFLSCVVPAEARH